MKNVLPCKLKVGKKNFTLKLIAQEACVNGKAGRYPSYDTCPYETILSFVPSKTSNGVAESTAQSRVSKGRFLIVEFLNCQ